MTIQEIGKEMAEQNNRATQYPLFVVQSQEKVYGDYSWCDEVERRDEYDVELLCRECKKLYDDSLDLPDHCDFCKSDCFVWFNWEDKFDLNAGVFFTAKACDQHIKLNHYLSQLIFTHRQHHHQKIFFSELDRL